MTAEPTTYALDFAPDQVREVTLVIHAVAASGCGYATILEGPVTGQVFINQSAVNRFNLRPGDKHLARVVPNYPDRSEKVAWRTIYIVPQAQTAPPAPAAAAPPAAEPVESEASLKERVEHLVLDGRVWTTREVFKVLMDREPSYTTPKDKLLASQIGNHLRTLCRHEKLWRTELFKHDSEFASAVYFSTDPDELRPADY